MEALLAYSSHLESSFVTVALPPTTPGTSIPPNFDLSPSYVNTLDDEFTRVYEEYLRRLSFVQSTSEDIVKLWAELGTPQAQTDAAIIQYYREAPEQLGLYESDLTSLKSKRERLLDEKRARERKIKDTKAAVESLWDRFGVEEADRKSFLAANRGSGLRVINSFQDELARLNELKRQNMHLFVEDARARLQDLWDSLYFSEEEILDFTPAFSDVCNDALLKTHEAEIERLNALKEQRAPMLHLVDRHRGLLEERDALNASSQDASRLMARGNKGEKRDPGKLLREEKMRKRIAKELPKVEAELRTELLQWEEDFGRPFLVYGERYVDELELPPHAAAGTKHPPPSRAKTPATASKVQSTVRQAPPISSRPASTSKVPSVVPRSVTKTPTGAGGSGSIRHIKQSSATIKSPSRIPARAPLSNIPHNNPDRLPNFSAYTISGKAPSRAPIPARMRAMTNESKDQSSTIVEPYRSNSALSNNSLVRSVTPVDVYDDHHHPSFMSTSSSIFSHPSGAVSSNSSVQSAYRVLPANSTRLPNPYLTPAPPAARHVSDNSSAEHTVVSGSENWETFDDGSGSEETPDATERYYAKVAPMHRVPNNVSKGIIRSVSPEY